MKAEGTDTKVRKGAKDSLYIQLYGGINKSANENLPWTEFTSYPWSGGAFIGLGKEFTPLLGWRAAFRFNHNKSRNVQKCESNDTWGWNNLGLFGDVTFDITDLFSTGTLTRTSTGTLTGMKTKTKTRKFNLKAFVGVGVGYTFGFDNLPLSYTVAYSRASKVLMGFRGGFTATYRLSDHWRVGMELSQTMFDDHFNGVKADTPLDGRTNISVGFTYMLTKSKPKRKNKVRQPVIMDNRLRVVPVLPFMLPEPEGVKRRQIAGRAFLDFPVNETIIYPQYRQNPNELKRIRATVDSALFDNTIKVTRISLHGYASPESPYSNNTRLAKGRTAALMEYISKKYNLPSSVFHTEFTPEDWQNLREFIADGDRRRVKGDIWYENAEIHETPATPNCVLNNRDELLSVIDKNIDPDEKEDMLKKVAGGEPYNWLLTYVYPGLRHTDYIIEYVVREYPVSNARKLIYTHPEALSLNEMYRVANSYEEGSDDWLDALLIAAKTYPNDQTANLNAACACVKTKRLVDAKRYLAKAGNSEQTQYVANVIRAMEGSVQWKMEDGKVVVNGNGNTNGNVNGNENW